MMQLMQMAAGGAVFGVIAGMWNHIKTMFWKICNLFVQDIQIMDNDVASVVISHLVQNYTRLGLYDQIYGGYYEYIRTHQRRGLVGFEYFGSQSIIFRDGWRILLWRASTTTPNQSNPNSPGTKTSACLMFIRGTFDAQKIMSGAVKQYNELTWASDNKAEIRQRRFFIKYVPDIDKDIKKDEGGRRGADWQYKAQFRLIDHRPEDIGYGSNQVGSKLDKLFFPNEVTKLIEEIKIWRQSQDYYQKLGMSWKRGWLIYGPGGTGKTALASAFAHDLDMPLFVYNLSELYNSEFMREWKQMTSHAPCIALIEDFDNTFHGRKNITRGDEMNFGRIWSNLDKDNKKDDTDGQENEVQRRFGTRLNFDVLLNCLDGVDRCDGVFTIITTNHIEHIDEALGRPVMTPDGVVKDFTSTRPGRIDRAIELTYMKDYVKRRMAESFLEDHPDLLAAILEEIDQHPITETPAQFQNRIGQLALKAYWNKANGIQEEVMPRNGHARQLTMNPDLGSFVLDVSKTMSPVDTRR